jgi:hypothetical protein
MRYENNQPADMGVQAKRALSHPKRMEILGYIEQRPSKAGARKTEIATALGLGGPLLEYHLKVLHEADLIAQPTEFVFCPL